MGFWDIPLHYNLNVNCLLFILRHPYWLSKVGAALLTTDMLETSIAFGEFGARVMIENNEVQHYATHVDPVKKEVSCWIASEEGKVCEPFFAIQVDTKLFIPTNLGVFSRVV